MALRWYVQRLSSNPWSTNLTTAAVLMTVGDTSAQWLEHRRMQEQESARPKHENGSHTVDTQPVVLQPRRTTVQYRLYGKLSPPVQVLQHELHEQHRRHKEMKEESTTGISLFSLGSHLTTLRDWLSEERLKMKSYDWFRTSTMVTWATFVYTPYFLGLFRLYAVYWPTTSSTSIWAQAGLRAVSTFTASIPLTVAFFGYGCAVHQAAEAWFAPKEASETIEKFVEEEVVLRTANLWTAFQLKLKAELVPTLATGALLWIPVNFANFSLVPPPMRSVVLMFVSVFWNGYLSLAQHRNVDPR